MQGHCYYEPARLCVFRSHKEVEGPVSMVTVIVTVMVTVLLQCTDAGVSITLLTLLPAYAYTVCAVCSPWHMGSITGYFARLNGWQLENALITAGYRSSCRQARRH